MKVLFLCTGNSCRSQMAEGWARELHGDRVVVASAGTAPQSLDPRAVEVMRELGVDISGHRAKSIDEVDLRGLDLVITLCADAQESCPTLDAAVRVVHVGFADPPRSVRRGATEEEALSPYRQVRDEIRAFLSQDPKQWREGR